MNAALPLFAAPAVDVASIAARTMLCTLNTSAWRATRYHRAETAAERKRHKTDAPRVLVTVCEHPALSELAALHQKAYAEHRRLTLPTIQDGLRMVPAARQLEHSQRMHELYDAHQAIVARFLADYDAEAASAPARLNGLYDPSMWPSHDAVARRFGFGTRYLPCPTAGEWAEWIAESARTAQDDLAERLRECLARVRERCASDGKLYATVFENLADVLALVPDLDLSGELASVAAAAAPLARLSADTLRDDEDARAAASSKAASILTLLGGVK